MLDCERFRHHRTDTAGTGKSREGHQQVAEQWEQQFHAEWNSNRLSTVSKSALHLPVLPKSAIRHTQANTFAPRTDTRTCTACQKPTTTGIINPNSDSQGCSALSTKVGVDWIQGLTGIATIL